MRNAQMQAVEALIAPSLTDLGYEVVRVTMMGVELPTLQVMAERLDEDAMTVEDCASISRTVSAILDVEDPISGAFTLEVSSPGLDRPLVRQKDFERYTGLEAKVELRQALNGQRRYRGVLAGYADGVVTIVTENGATDLPFGEIDKAKLIITDELLAAGSAEEAKQGRA
ncbi:MAG: ribosome maturation factor RimP [Pseudomonadota bacterium]|jgi:ribosome maturation factor RimP|nr:ribosome maturation factor RimP [Pseudomonadota bacterium]